MNSARRAYRLFYFGIFIALIGTIGGAVGVVIGVALREWSGTSAWMMAWGLLFLLVGAGAMVKADRSLRNYQEAEWSS